MNLVRWDPFRELNSLQNSISRLFDETLGTSLPEKRGRGSAFPVDVRNNQDSIEVTAELPGMEKENIKIDFENKILTIQGERLREEKEESGSFIRVEREFGSFSRSFGIDVPVKVDKIKASYKDGVLKVVLPKEDISKASGINIEID